MTRKPVVTRHPAHWIADRDGIDHARSHLRGPRTACGLVAIDERYAWPPTAGRCGLCLAVFERVEEVATD